MDTDNVVLWFRNDLRIDDNPALEHARTRGCSNAYFLTTEKQWQQHGIADIKIDFIQRHLALLSYQLQKFDIQLHIVEVGDFSGQIKFITDLVKQHKIEEVVCNSELELNEVKRDEKLSHHLDEMQCRLTRYEADTILPKGAILNKQGSMFQVFTPFKKAWLEVVNISGSNSFLLPDLNNDSTFEEKSKSISSKWPLANVYLTQVLPDFLHNKVTEYKSYRDMPAIKATSGLSPYLAIGAISAKRVMSELLSRYPQLPLQTDTQAFSWLNELVWREFYRNVLFHNPNLIKGGSYNSKYDALNWPDRQKEFEAWANGKTGYPIVDAAMQQLIQTGWMHNRLRMITASFLTKNLLVDWRKGEAFFMSHLIDGDFAANNGGWQWSAGTGCDAQPYFRVFNPVTQSKKFDPDGSFIKKFLPELANVPTKYIHEPFEYLNATGQANKYPAPMVDLKSTRLQAIDFYGFK
jgi:deoxyribodipyrimidine photo-lyase